MKFDEVDTIDIDDFFENKFSEISEKCKECYVIVEEDLTQNLLAIVSSLQYLTEELSITNLKINYYINLRESIFLKLYDKYKYAAATYDFKEIKVKIESSIDWQKADTLVFGYDNLKNEIESHLRNIKKQIFNIKDIIDYQKMFLGTDFK